jgi:hypothetical protein
MKKLLLILIAMMFISGCIRSDYSHKIYGEDNTIKEEWNVSRSMANINQSLGIGFIKFSDGTVIYLKNNKIKDSPESARAEAELISAIMSGGSSTVVKEITN